MPNTAMAAVTRTMVELPLVIQPANGSATQAEMEASETYRVKANTSTQTPKMINSAPGTSANSTPAEVAMPLPPLKCSQQVKLWPSTAPRPAQIRNQACVGVPVPALNQHCQQSHGQPAFKAIGH